jgi:hypothetical protein
MEHIPAKRALPQIDMHALRSERKIQWNGQMKYEAKMRKARCAGMVNEDVLCPGRRLGKTQRDSLTVYLTI